MPVAYAPSPQSPIDAHEAEQLIVANDKGVGTLYSTLRPTMALLAYNSHQDNGTVSIVHAYPDAQWLNWQCTPTRCSTSIITGT